MGAGLKTDKMMEGWRGQTLFVEHQMWWEGLFVENRRIGLLRNSVSLPSASLPSCYAMIHAVNCPISGNLMMKMK